MNRARLLSMVLVFALLVPLLLTAAQEPAGASMFQGDAANTGIQPGPGPDSASDIVERWRVEIEEASDVAPGGGYPSGVATLDGIAYFGAIDGSVRAVEIETGSEIWTASGSAAKQGTPAIADGVLYISDWNQILWAFDIADGSMLWTFPFGEPRAFNYRFPVFPSPTVANDIVYFGALDGVLYAIDAESGRQRWRSEFESAFVATPIVVDGLVFAGAFGGSLRALDAETGEVRWELPDTAQVLSSLTAFDGVVYFKYYEGIAAIEAQTGEILWDLPLYGAYTTPAVLDDLVIFSNISQVIAIDAATGQERWSYTPDIGRSNYELGSSPVVADGVVYIGCIGALCALDASTGSELWRFEVDTGNRYLTSITVDDGLVLFGAGPYAVVAVGNPSDAMIEATAQAATAAANEQATADANATVTAQAAATAAAEAAMTATAEAEIRATEEAIEATWEAYFVSIGDALSASPDLPPSMTIEAPDVEFIEPDAADGEPDIVAEYDVAIAGGSGETFVGVALFGTSEDAASAYATAIDGATRSGWQQESIDGLDEQMTCFSIVRDGVSEAGCYGLRGDALVIAYSSIDTDARGAVVLNVAELIRLMDTAYVSVARPEV